MKLKIKYHADIPKIEKIEVGDWIDLRSAETVKIKKNQFKLISLGVSMKLPFGYEAHVLPRSSTFKNYGIIMTNSMGIIDNSYSGTNDVWKFPAYCVKSKTKWWKFWDRSTTIKKGDRIAQFKVVPSQDQLDVVEVETLDETDRGGFGSTGKD